MEWLAGSISLPKENRRDPGGFLRRPTIARSHRRRIGRRRKVALEPPEGTSAATHVNASSRSSSPYRQSRLAHRRSVSTVIATSSAPASYTGGRENRVTERPDSWNSGGSSSTSRAVGRRQPVQPSSSSSCAPARAPRLGKSSYSSPGSSFTSSTKRSSSTLPCCGRRCSRGGEGQTCGSSPCRRPETIGRAAPRTPDPSRGSR